MRRKLLLKTLLIVLTALSLASCASPSNYSPVANWNQHRFGCSGDIPSNYPPYCRPSH